MSITNDLKGLGDIDRFIVSTRRNNDTIVRRGMRKSRIDGRIDSANGIIFQLPVVFAIFARDDNYPMIIHIK